MRKNAFILLASLAAAIPALIACAGPEPTPAPAPARTAMVTSPTRTPIPTATPIPTPTSTPMPVPKPTPAPTRKPRERPTTKRGGEALGREAALAFDQGTELLDQGRHREAAEEFRKAIRAQGAPSWTLEYYAAVAFQEDGDSEGAIPHLTNAAGIRDNAEIRARRALMLLQQENCGAALRDALEALRMEPIRVQPDLSPGFSRKFSPEAEANWVAAACRKQTGQINQARKHARAALWAALETGYENTGRFHSAFLELEHGPTPPAPPGPLEPSTEPSTEPEKEPNQPPGPTSETTGQPEELSPGEISRQLDRVADLRSLRRNRPQAAIALAEIPWVRDGMNEMEQELAAELALLFSQKDAAGAIPVLQVKFLKSPREGDLEALRSLRKIRERSPLDYQDIMERLGTEAGDPETPRIAVLLPLWKDNPELARKVLEPGTLVMNRMTTAYRSGNIRLAVIIPGEDQDRAGSIMEELEGAVQAVTSLMQEPLGHRMVTLLVADAAADTPRDVTNGKNFGEGIIIPAAPRDPVSARHIITHEIAHHYWRGNSHWVDEGMADHIASILESQRSGRKLGTPRWPCGSHRVIQDLPDGEQATTCDYSLGNRIFLDLHLETERNGMLRSIRELYRKSLAYDSEEGMSLEMKELRELFPPHVHTTPISGSPGEFLEETHSDDRGIIDRWETGEGGYRDSEYDTDQPDPQLIGMEGEITDARVIIGNRRPRDAMGGTEENAGAWLQVNYTHGGEPGEFELEILTIYQDGLPIVGPEVKVQVRESMEGNDSQESIAIPLGLRAGETWARGRYVTYIYEEGRKVGQTNWSI